MKIFLKKIKSWFDESRLGKTIVHSSYFFEALEGYLFLKNKSFILTPLLFFRNFYRYFNKLKTDRLEEIINKINRQTVGLPPLSKEDFILDFNHYLSQKTLIIDIDLVFNREEGEAIKITRSCCLDLREKIRKKLDENQTFIDKIAEKYADFFAKNFSETFDLEQKKIFLENLLMACHMNDQDGSYCLNGIYHLRHFSEQETFARFELILKKSRNKKTAINKITYLMKLNKWVIESQKTPFLPSSLGLEQSKANIDSFQKIDQPFLKVYPKFKEFISVTWQGLLFSANALKWANFFIVSLALLVFPVNWSLIFFPLVMAIYFGIFCFARYISHNYHYNKTLIFPEEKNETHDIESFISQLMSERSHDEQLISLLNQPCLLTMNWDDFLLNDKHLSKKFYAKIDKKKLAKDKIDSFIYAYVYDIKEKTQFFLLIFTHAVNTAFCATLLSWTASFILSQLALTTLMSIVASPLFLVGLASILFIVTLVNHGIDSYKRKQSYKQKIEYHLEKTCSYEYIDDLGNYHSGEIKQWEKFEYLRNDILLLQEQIKRSLEQAQEAIFSTEFTEELKIFLEKKGIFEYHFRDKDFEECRSQQNACESFLSRLTAFFSGAVYGFSLQYSLFKGGFLFKSLLTLSLPILIVFLIPLSLLTGLANWFVYKLQREQEKRLFFLEHLEAKLFSLEQRKANLLYIDVILKTVIAQQIEQNKKEVEIMPKIASQLSHIQTAVAVQQEEVEKQSDEENLKHYSKITEKIGLTDFFHPIRDNTILANTRNQERGYRSIRTLGG